MYALCKSVWSFFDIPEKPLGRSFHILKAEDHSTTYAIMSIHQQLIPYKWRTIAIFMYLYVRIVRMKSTCVLPQLCPARNERTRGHFFHSFIPTNIRFLTATYGFITGSPLLPECWNIHTSITKLYSLTDRQAIEYSLLFLALYLVSKVLICSSSRHSVDL